MRLTHLGPPQPVTVERSTHRWHPPLALAGIAVPLALAASLAAPIMLADASRGPDTPLMRFVVELVAFLLAFVGVWLADQARVPPSVLAENMRILLLLGGMVAAMFSAAFLWLAGLQVVGSVL